ncbi:MAG: hypothetical protein U0790_05575 [Isosphaeraceae bacterium]
MLAIGPILLAVGSLLAFGAYRLLSLDWVDDGYALWGAGEMVVAYLRDHDARWPAGWEDLRPYYEAGGGRVGGWSFEEYQRHVNIRWDVDVTAIRGAARGHHRPSFRVIEPREWLAGSIGGREPNQILHDYFREASRPQVRPG